MRFTIAALMGVANALKISQEGGDERPQRVTLEDFAEIMFTGIDDDGSGTISQDEALDFMGDLLGAMGEKIWSEAEEGVNDAFVEFDVDGDGELDFEELGTVIDAMSSMWEEEGLTVEALAETMVYFLDSNGNGSICV